MQKDNYNAMNKISQILLFTTLTCFTLASQAFTCPGSDSEAQKGGWYVPSQYQGRVPNYSRFEGVVYRQGRMYCAYKDRYRPPNLAILGKWGYAKPALGGLWRTHKEGIICTKSRTACTFQYKSS